MSKTKLTGIAPAQITDHFGVDAFRWYFLRAIQFGSDGSFSWEDMSARYTSELANGLGNLVSRVAAMVGKYSPTAGGSGADGTGVLPDPTEPGPAEAGTLPADYPFVRVEGDGVHEIAVGPVHAGIIEPGSPRVMQRS